MSFPDETKEDYIREGRLLERKAILSYLRLRAVTETKKDIDYDDVPFTYEETKIDVDILYEIELHQQHYLTSEDIDL